MILFLLTIGLFLIIAFLYSLFGFVRYRNNLKNNWIKLENKCDKAKEKLKEEGLYKELKDYDSEYLHKEYHRIKKLIEELKYPEDEDFIIDLDIKLEFIREILNERNITLDNK